jgi:hypothetical protein
VERNIVPQSSCKRSPSMRECSDSLRGPVCSSIWDPFCPSVAQRSRGPLDSGPMALRSE